MLKYTPENHADIIQHCVDALQIPGCVILIPTETVYGLVCRWGDSVAINKIYTLKQRDTNKLLAMFAPDMPTALYHGAIINPAAEKLFARFTPGAITLVLDSRCGGTIGVRIPDHQLVLELLQILDFPLASTSANLSGTPAALSVESALTTLNGKPDLIIDGGALPETSTASTVVRVLENSVQILRQGQLPSSAIADCLEITFEN